MDPDTTPSPPCPTCAGTGIAPPADVIRDRRGDHDTSTSAAEHVTKREGPTLAGIVVWSDRHRLLDAFWQCFGGEATDEEAAERAGMLDTKICWWKRCGELRKAGYIVHTDETRPSSITGRERKVSRVTSAGSIYLLQLNAARESA